LKPIIVSLHDKTPRAVEYLWPGRVAVGKLTLFAGDPGTGKSFVAYDIAARVSTRTPWPDGTENPGGDVLILSAEDAVEDTILPRLLAAKANLKRIRVMQAVEVDEGAAMFSLETDIPALERALDDYPDTRLITIDPLTAYTGSIDSHKNAEVRGLLAPLADLADARNVAILCITHLNKSSGSSPNYRIIGSLAFSAATRAVWAIGKDKEDESRRIMTQVKNNLSADPGALAYRIIESDQYPGMGVVSWESGPVVMSAEDLLSNDRPKKAKLSAAGEWLLDILKDGPVQSDTIFRLAEDCGFRDRTVWRAKSAINGSPGGPKIATRKSGFGGPWEWYLEG